MGDWTRLKQFIINIYDHEVFDFTPYNGRIGQELVRSTKNLHVKGIPELASLYSAVKVHAIMLTFYDEIDAFKFEIAYDKPFQYPDCDNTGFAGVWEKLSGDQIQAAVSHLRGLT